MSKITVTTIAGQTSGSDANTVKIESGDTLAVQTNATVGGNVTVTGDIIKSTSGTSNFAAGVNAGNSIASGGNYNTVVGDEAGTAITTGDNNTLIGTFSGDAITISSANTGVGSYTLTSMINGANNVAVGTSALDVDTRGSKSTAVGRNALGGQNFTNATDTHNTAVGFDSSNDITTGQYNTAVGSLSLQTNQTGAQNCGIGYKALEVTTGGFNTAIGAGSGRDISSGSKNTIVGTYGGNQDSLDIRTLSNNIVISDGDGNARLYYLQGSTKNWHINVPANSNNALRVKNKGVTDEYGISIELSSDSNNGSNHFIQCLGSTTARFKVFTNGNAVNTNNSYGSISDEKLKENIVDSGSQWDDIKALKVRKYSLKEDKLDAPNKIGVIAQELETSGMNGLVVDTPDLDEDLKDLGTVTKAVNYSILYMKAVKALQEAMTRIETLETEVTKLKG